MQPPTPPTEETQGPDTNVEALPVHKGLFGIHGLARDILGAIGDGYLTAHGQKLQYAPQRDRERQSDALRHFSDQPDEAVQRLSNAGFSEEAMALQDNLAKQNTAGANQQSQAQLRRAQLRATQDKGYGPIGGYAATINKNNYSMLTQRLKKLAETYQIDIGEPPADYDKGGKQWASELTTAATGAYKQSRLDQIAESLGIQQQNADTNEQAANVGNLVKVGNAYTGIANSGEKGRHNRVQEDANNPDSPRYRPPGGKGKSFGGSSGKPPGPPPPGHNTATDPKTGVTWRWNGKDWIK